VKAKTPIRFLLFLVGVLALIPPLYAQLDGSKPWLSYPSKLEQPCDQGEVRVTEDKLDQLSERLNDPIGHLEDIFAGLPYPSIDEIGVSHALDRLHDIQKTLDFSKSLVELTREMHDPLDKALVALDANRRIGELAALATRALYSKRTMLIPHLHNPAAIGELTHSRAVLTDVALLPVCRPR